MHKLPIITLLLSSLSFLVCSQNLILNPSFEQFNQPYCEGWYDSCGNKFDQQCDSMIYCGSMIIHESPPVSNSGEWCLKVYGSFPNTGYADTYISGHEGTLIYQLKFWLNTEHFIGEVYLGPMQNRTFIDSNSLIAFGEPWKEYTLLDTIATTVTDTIGVRLLASIGDFCLCDVAFDQIELTIIDTLTTGIKFPTQYPHCNIFPNPITDQVSIELRGYAGFDVTIFDINGKDVAHAQSISEIVSVDLTNASSGIYFYQLTSIDHMNIYGRGKLIKE